MGELYRLFPHWDIQLPNIKMDLRWFVTFVCMELKFLLALLINNITKDNKGLRKWANVILVSFIIQDMGWLIYNGQNPYSSLYWTIFYSIVFIDTLFFAKYWWRVLFGRKTLKKS